MIVANRANSRKSTGPRTALGKRNASRNAGKHLVYAGVSPATMKELGEDPAEFEKLRQSWRDALRPRDGFEEKLVEEMAANRWRLARLHRAETGILAVQQINLESKVKARSVHRGLSYDNLLIRCQGLTGVSESQEKYAEILRVLISLAEKVEKEGFCPAGLELLEMVYGSSPGVTGVGLISQYKTQLERQKARSQTQNDDEESKAAREQFLRVSPVKLRPLPSRVNSFRWLRICPCPGYLRTRICFLSRKTWTRLCATKPTWNATLSASSSNWSPGEEPGEKALMLKPLMMNQVREAV